MFTVYLYLNIFLRKKKMLTKCHGFDAFKHMSIEFCQIVCARNRKSFKRASNSIYFKIFIYEKRWVTRSTFQSIKCIKDVHKVNISSILSMITEVMPCHSRFSYLMCVVYILIVLKIQNYANINFYRILSLFWEGIMRSKVPIV